MFSIDCLSWIGLQELSKHYYTYKGSLTTAPYFESVTWIIYRTPIYVSKKQVNYILFAHKSMILLNILNSIKNRSTYSAIFNLARRTRARGSSTTIVTFRHHTRSQRSRSPVTWPSPSYSLFPIVSKQPTHTKDVINSATDSIYHHLHIFLPIDGGNFSLWRRFANRLICKCDIWHSSECALLLLNFDI